MMVPTLHRDPAAIDTRVHRNWRQKHPVTDWTVAARLNSMFVAAVEFADVCCEYPILFVPMDVDDKGVAKSVAPIAAFGLSPDENLYLEGTGWRARYIPALLRAYPFGLAKTNDEHMVITIDQGWEGWSQSEGERLFDDQGQPTAYMQGVRDQLVKIDEEVQRTRFLGDVLLQNDLLQPMRFDATLPDGQTLTVEGFLALNAEKLDALPDDKVLEMHRNGVMSLIHAHNISMRHMRKLLDWRLAAAPSAPGATAAQSAGA